MESDGLPRIKTENQTPRELQPDCQNDGHKAEYYLQQNPHKDQKEGYQRKKGKCNLKVEDPISSAPNAFAVFSCLIASFNSCTHFVCISICNFLPYYGIHCLGFIVHINIVFLYHLIPSFYQTSFDSVIIFFTKFFPYFYIIDISSIVVFSTNFLHLLLGTFLNRIVFSVFYIY